jgi:NAD-dependent deacetylase
MNGTARSDNKHRKMRKRIAILTGAGMSAESGLSTFRDSDGLWEGHDVYEVATPEGWAKNNQLVLDFYNDRRRQLNVVEPNAGHLAISKLEKKYDIQIITQNVDNLHERAGSSNVLHLHGELNKVRSTVYEELVYDWSNDLHLGDKCEKGYQLRPHIVWFGEAVPMLEKAIIQILKSDLMIIVGTSMQVYPAASLVSYLPEGKMVYYVDPNPNISYELAKSKNLKIVTKTAAEGLPIIIDSLLS